ncbi:hypothetical protein Tco_0888494, partial [Tanacetum coccineum]
SSAGSVQMSQDGEADSVGLRTPGVILYRLESEKNSRTSGILAVIAPKPIVSTDIPSSTIIYQDAPSTSTSQTTQETPSPVIPLSVEEANHNIEVAYMDNNSSFGIPILKPSSEES